MGLRDGPEPPELGIGEVELDPLVARLVAAVCRLCLCLLDRPLSPAGLEFNGVAKSHFSLLCIQILKLWSLVMSNHHHNCCVSIFEQCNLSQQPQ